MIRRVAFALLLLSSSAVMADSWMPPSRETYHSQDKSARLTVTPRDLESSLAYFEDKVDRREPAGAPKGSTARNATALLERHAGSSRWETLWSGRLLNEIAPVEAVVAARGQGFATFDNWYSTGYGSNAVVIYRADGTVVRQLGLNDLFPKWFVAALPHSVSSIHWRGEPRISGDGAELIIPIVQPSNEDPSVNDYRMVDLAIRMSDGVPVGLEQPAWKRTMAEAAATARQRCKDERHATAEWNAPISAPSTNEEQDWHHYLREIYYRTAPIVDGDFPDAVGTTVLRPPAASDFQASVGWLKDALTEETTIPGSDVNAIGSPDYERLTHEIETIMRGQKPGRLKGIRLIIPMGASHEDRLKAALSRSGAELVVVDPSTQFPQRPERLRKDLSPVCEAPEPLTARATWGHALPFLLLGAGIFALRRLG